MSMLSYPPVPPYYPTPSTSCPTSLPSPTPSSASSSTKPTTKPQRRARPCEACKVRRVGCKRTLELKDSCDWCHERGVRCITDNTPYTRKGKRIEQAKEAFGVVGVATPSRTENLMAANEMTLSLGYHLVEVYVDGGYSKRDRPHFILPCANWRLFKEKFEEAGRDPMKLGPCGQVRPPFSLHLQPSPTDSPPISSQVVSYIVFANAARVSQHSAIAGYSKQSPAEILIRDSESSPNMATNENRNSAYQSLINKAVQLCDENAIWRTEAPDSQVAMVVMFLMYYLVCDGDLGKKAAQHYSKSAMELLRLTYEDAGDERKKNIGDFDSFAWVTLILDAYSSAESGKPPRMTEADIASYIGAFPAFLTPPSTSKFIVVAVSTSASERFWQPWLGAIKFAVDLARAVGGWKRLGGGLEMVKGFWKALKEVEDWAKVATAARAGLAPYLQNFCELYTDMIWACATVLHSIIRDHLAVLLARSDPTLLEENDSGSFTELVLISAVASQKTWESMTEFIHGTKNERGVYILSVITGTIFSVSRLVVMARDFLSHLPLDERPFLEKRSGLEFLYRLLVKTHQSWPDPVLEEVTTLIFTELLRSDGSVVLDPTIAASNGEVTDEVTKKRSRIMLEWAMMDCLEFME